MRRVIYQREEIQIVFKSDADLKDQALLKARCEGVTLKAVLTMAMRAYVDDDLEIFFGRKEKEKKKVLSPPKNIFSLINKKSHKMKILKN